VGMVDDKPTGSEGHRDGVHWTWNDVIGQLRSRTMVEVRTRKLLTVLLSSERWSSMSPSNWRRAQTELPAVSSLSVHRLWSR